MKNYTKFNVALTLVSILMLSIIAFAPQDVPNLGKEITCDIVWRDSAGNIKGKYNYAFAYGYTALNHNLVTDNGLEFVEDSITSGSTTDIAKYIQFSTDTSPASGDAQIPATQITGNGLDRAEGTITDIGTGHFHVYELFTLTGTQSGIGSVWLTYKSSNTNPDTFCGIAIDPVINAISGDTIEVTISVEITNT